MIAHKQTLASVLAVSVALFAAGCGGSSKPAFCGDVSTLEQSVKQIDPTAGLSALKTQVGNVAGNAATAVSSAKSDFPEQTSALETAITKLKTGIDAATSSPTPQGIVAVAGDAKAVVDAVSSLVSAAKSKCS